MPGFHWTQLECCLVSAFSARGLESQWRNGVHREGYFGAQMFDTCIHFSYWTFFTNVLKTLHSTLRAGGRSASLLSQQSGSRCWDSSSPGCSSLGRCPGTQAASWPVTWHTSQCSFCPIKLLGGTTLEQFELEYPLSLNKITKACCEAKHTLNFVNY